MPPEDEIHDLRADVAGLSARVVGLSDHIMRVDKWLQTISDEIRKKPERNTTPIYVGLLMAVSVLMTLGTFALAPVADSVERIGNQVETLRDHDADGHPEAVKDLLKQMDASHTKERDRMLMVVDKLDGEVHNLVTRQAELFTIAEERTMRFIRTLEQRDKLSELRSRDRLTATEHKLHADSLEGRLQRLEQMPANNGGGNDH